MPTTSAAPKFMPVIHVFRLLLEDALPTIRNERTTWTESRRTARRSSIRLKATFTLSEWLDLVDHIKSLSYEPAHCIPETVNVTSLGVCHKEMQAEVVSFMSLMMSLGRFDVEQFVRNIAVTRNFRRSTPFRSPFLLRLIGDYVLEEPSFNRPGRSAMSNDRVRIKYRCFSLQSA